MPQDVSGEYTRDSWGDESGESGACCSPCYIAQGIKQNSNHKYFFSLVATSPSTASPSPHQLSTQPSYASLSDVTRNARRQSRRLLSQAPPSARESDDSLVSSVEAPSTLHEPRISVSSIVYPGSLYEDEMATSPIPTVTDEFGTQRSAVNGATPDTFQVQTQAQPLPHPYAHPSGSHVSKLYTPVGLYPSTSPSSSATIHEPPIQRPASSDQMKRFLVPKPAIPTAPKPDFRRSRSVQPDHRLSMISTSPSPPLLSKPGAFVHNYGMAGPQPDRSRGSSVPSTTNILNPQERADLIRKSRKLTQLFGQTPSPISGPGSLSDSQVPNNMLLPVVLSRRLHIRGVR